MLRRSVPIVDYAGYSVDTCGNVYDESGSLVKTYINNGGYTTVFLYGVPVQIHKLVAEAYLEKRSSADVICHINGDRTDSRLENLMYLSRSEVYRRAARGKEVL